MRLLLTALLLALVSRAPDGPGAGAGPGGGAGPPGLERSRCQGTGRREPPAPGPAPRLRPLRRAWAGAGGGAAVGLHGSGGRGRDAGPGGAGGRDRARLCRAAAAVPGGGHPGRPSAEPPAGVQAGEGGVAAGGAPGGRVRRANSPLAWISGRWYIGQLVLNLPGEAREGSFKRQADLRALQGRQATGRDPHHLQAQSQA